MSTALLYARRRRIAAAHRPAQSDGRREPRTLGTTATLTILAKSLGAPVLPRRAAGAAAFAASDS